MSQEFTLEEIEDARIIFEVKGKHYAIAPKEKAFADVAKSMRIAAATAVLLEHVIVTPSLEEIGRPVFTPESTDAQEAAEKLHDPSLYDLDQIKKVHGEAAGKYADMKLSTDYFWAPNEYAKRELRKAIMEAFYTGVYQRNACLPSRNGYTREDIEKAIDFGFYYGQDRNGIPGHDSKEQFMSSLTTSNQ